MAINRFLKITLALILLLIFFFTPQNKQEDEKISFYLFSEMDLDFNLDLKTRFKDLIHEILNILKKLSIISMVISILLIGFPFLDFYSFVKTCECMGKVDETARKIVTKDGQILIRQFLFVDLKFIIPPIRWMHKKPIIQYIFNYDEIIMRLLTRSDANNNIWIGKACDGSEKEQYLLMIFQR
jgi:hypothetical protein